MDVQQYRKKPVVIEAVQLTRDNFDAVGQWAGVKECWGLDAPHPALFIDTIEGTMKAWLGWWVIKGIKGEFYPCDPDIFAGSYERADTPVQNFYTAFVKEVQDELIIGTAPAAAVVSICTRAALRVQNKFDGVPSYTIQTTE